MKNARLGLPIAGALLALVACRDKSTAPPAPRAPAPIVRTSSAATFEMTREGPRPVFRQGDLHVYVSPNAAHLDFGLPGVAFGDAKGPQYGLLGGYFAPQVLAPDSARAYRAEIDNRSEGLRVRFFAEDALALDVEIPGRAAQARLHGPTRLAMPADRVTVYGTRGGAPAFSRTLTAGEPPGVDVRWADRVEVTSAKRGAHAVSTSCDRVALVATEPRGSTSVFVLGLGGARVEDALYAPPKAAEADFGACSGTVTSTLTLPTANPG